MFYVPNQQYNVHPLVVLICVQNNDRLPHLPKMANEIISLYNVLNTSNDHDGQCLMLLKNLI